MKRVNSFLPQKTLWLILSVLVIGFSACEEEPPAIDFSDRQPPKDTTYVDPSVTAATQPKNVILEDFTGVNCPNCPKAQAKAKEIQTANPGRVVVVSIHPGPPVFPDLCSPFNSPPHVSKFDFRTEDGKNLIGLVAQPPAQGLPSVVINRKRFNGEPSTALLQVNSFAGYTDAELAAGSPLKMEFKSLTYDSVSRKLTVKVKLTYTQPEADSNYLTLGLVESGMVDVQKDGLTYNDDYEHEHVLRKLITSSSGDLLSVQKSIGRVVEREYSTTLNQSSWVARNMAIYALVHKDAQKLEVLQVIEKKLIP